MQLTDTHCHIQAADYPLDVSEVEARAAQAGVTRLICVGYDVESSRRAIEFVQNRPNAWASVGLHPHEAKTGESEYEKLADLIKSPRVPSSPFPAKLRQLASRELAREPSETTPAAGASSKSSSSTPAEAAATLSSRAVREALSEHDEMGGAARGTDSSKIVAIGECGLDYFYSHSDKQDQEKALRFQIELALEYDLPLIFHVRDAFDDFWPILDSYPTVRGVLHSFTDTQANLEKALQRGLYVGVNGIVTFTKLQWQLDAIAAVPLERLLLETDAPFLTPKPLRGRVNEPAHIELIAKFVSDLRHVSLHELANATTANALHLFSIS